MTYDTWKHCQTILLDAINIHWEFFLLISPYKISPESHIKKHVSLKEMITNKKMLLIIVQILLASILRNV